MGAETSDEQRAYAEARRRYAIRHHDEPGPGSASPRDVEKFIAGYNYAYTERLEQVDDLRAEVEQLRAKIARVEALAVKYRDWKPTMAHPLGPSFGAATQEAMNFAGEDFVAALADEETKR